MKANKKEWVGTEERIGVLLPFLPEVKDLLLEGMTGFKGKVVADDILDALAALVTIGGEEGPLNTLPGFRRPFGSKASLTLFMRGSTSPPSCRGR